MTLSIQNPEADRLAHILADMRGVSLDEAVLDALQEQIFHTRLKKDSAVTALEKQKALEEVQKIVARLQLLSVHDSRTEDEIIGYNENGCFD